MFKKKLIELGLTCNEKPNLYKKSLILVFSRNLNAFSFLGGSSHVHKLTQWVTHACSYKHKRALNHNNSLTHLLTNTHTHFAHTTASRKQTTDAVNCKSLFSTCEQLCDHFLIFIHNNPLIQTTPK